MKRKTIIGTAIFAAFLMLSAMVFVTPVTAQIAYEPDAEELDLDLADIMNSLTNNLAANIENFNSAITENNEMCNLFENIQNNPDLQKLIEQIQNTDDVYEKYNLAEQLIDLLYSLPEYQQLESLLVESDFISDKGSVNEDTELLLSYIESLQDESELYAILENTQNNLELEGNSNSVLDDFTFVIPAACMQLYNPDVEETNQDDNIQPQRSIIIDSWVEAIIVIAWILFILFLEFC